MNNEEFKTNKLRISFDIDVPNDATKSDFYSLVLRLSNLRHFIETQDRDIISITSNNQNIQEMKHLLDNFIVKTVNENDLPF